MEQTLANTTNWLKSKEVESKLKVYNSHLMHLRLESKLSYTKNGNSFFYKKSDVKKIKAIFKNSIISKSRNK